MLRQADRQYLDSRGFVYEVAAEGSWICLVIKGFKLPQGYNRETCDLLLRLPQTFPMAAPDMWWMDPEVLYANGSVPPATELRETILGRQWQRWSRHLSIAWRPGTDDLQTYMRLVRTDLEQGAGVERKAA